MFKGKGGKGKKGKGEKGKRGKGERKSHSDKSALAGLFNCSQSWSQYGHIAI